MSTKAERETKVAGFDTFTAEAGRRNASPLPGSTEAIARLHAAGYRLGVATNNSTSGAEKTLLALGVAQMFDAAYGYDAVANPKPAPDSIIAFSRPHRPEARPRSPWSATTATTSKWRGPAGAGLAVGVLSGTGTRETLAPMADVVLDSIADLPGYLAGRGGAGYFPRSAAASWRLGKKVNCPACLLPPQLPPQNLPDIALRQFCPELDVFRPLVAGQVLLQ